MVRHAPPRRWIPTLVAAIFAVTTAAACGGASESEKDEGLSLDTPELTITKEDGKLVKRYDTDADGKVNIVAITQRYKDPDNPEITHERTVKKRVDVNADGTFDIVKLYDDNGILRKERVDGDLDGTVDRVNVYNTDTNALRKKIILDENGENPVTTRYFADGKLDKIDKDTDGDGEPDHFQYFKDGKLQRIGRDKDGDGDIEDWTHRKRRKKSVETGEASPSVSGGASGGDAK